jgi:hypothetical protein
MTARMIDQFGNVEEVSDATFFERVFGHPRLTKEQREQHQRDRDAWIERYKEETKRELRELQERCDRLREIAREQRHRDMEAVKALPPLEFKVITLADDKREAA